MLTYSKLKWLRLMDRALRCQLTCEKSELYSTIQLKLKGRKLPTVAHKSKVDRHQQPHLSKIYSHRQLKTLVRILIKFTFYLEAYFHWRLEWEFQILNLSNLKKTNRQTTMMRVQATTHKMEGTSLIVNSMLRSQTWPYSRTPRERLFLRFPSKTNAWCCSTQQT